MASMAVHYSGDRRQSFRGSIKGEPHRAKLVSLVLGTYREMPGMQLSLDEAMRMFGLREVTCRVLLEQLVLENRLRRTDDGRYARV
jgi:hypothetical protein